MKDRITEIIAETLGVEPDSITAEMGTGNCEQWDSLAQVVMISRISDELGIEIPFDAMMEIACAGDLLALAGE